MNDARSESEMSDTDDETYRSKPTENGHHTATTTPTNNESPKIEKNGVTKRKSPGKS